MRKMQLFGVLDPEQLEDVSDPRSLLRPDVYAAVLDDLVRGCGHQCVLHGEVLHSTRGDDDVHLHSDH